ncbi:MAG: glycosyltransferase family 2 protein [Acidobacteria bacterium]|nr:glycosyltransferase family 2 protein [Acidobacteriota bacterium]MCA1611850.1 glycosyltransferase family 2 protein [Acidobacteriota bacterium]
MTDVTHVTDTLTGPPAGPLLSIVMPTRDRCPILEKTLQRIEGSDEFSAAELEIVVVDDGSRDGTASFLSKARSRFPLRVARSEGEGPAAARNRGVRMATGSRILLLGDDTPPRAGTLREHASPPAPDVGIQGLIEWDPEVPVSGVMSFLAPEGPQFYFKGLRHGLRIPFTAVLASNLSAPASWFREDPFDERFRDAAFEDTELAFRWRRKKRAVLYSETAVCWHTHVYTTLEPFLARQRRAGRAVRYAVRRHPALFFRAVAQPLAVGAVFALRHAALRALRRASERSSWDLRVRGAFLRGLLSPAGTAADPARGDAAAALSPLPVPGEHRP